MLLYLCHHGSLDANGRYLLREALNEAEEDCRLESGRILVLDSSSLDLATTAPPSTLSLPAEAVLNMGESGYLPPEAVTAAGGYVVRRAPAGVELLMIYRRGAWDLPKGKLDPGESPEDGAEREVAEEVGIDRGRLARGGSLGGTVHGYPHPKRPTFAVKTTHWYQFTTDATEFAPQVEEDIESVEWVPWAEAGERLGYESLRRHHAGLDPGALGV